MVCDVQDQVAKGGKPMTSKYRIECTDCLHCHTHLCTDCYRNAYRADGTVAEDRWERIGCRREDGVFVCDTCGAVVTQRAIKCPLCGYEFCSEWHELPVAKVPLLGRPCQVGEGPDYM